MVLGGGGGARRIIGKGLGGMMAEKGSLRAHGASIARGDKIHAIVGVEGLIVDITSCTGLLGKEALREGDILSLDCGPEKGFVYRGKVPYQEDVENTSSSLSRLKKRESAKKLVPAGAGGVAIVHQVSSALFPQDSLKLYKGVQKSNDIFLIPENPKDHSFAQELHKLNVLGKEQGSQAVINKIMADPELKRKIASLIRTQDREDDTGGYFCAISLA